MAYNVLITGAERGLGFCLARLYLEKGYNVFACLRRQPGEKIAGLKSQYGEKLEFIQLDVSEDSSVNEAAREFSRKYGVLDILINNAAVYKESPGSQLEEIDINTALDTYNVNALGPLRVSKKFLPFVRKGSSRVIANISSEAGSISNNWRDREFAYCMSKAALNMQSAILQKYVKPEGIKVLAIHPGWMRTDMGGSNADIDASTAAEGIVALIEKYRGDIDGPLYMDYTGKTMTF